MLRDMFFTLSGWLMFALGVLLGSYVKTLFGSAKSAVGG